MPVVAIVQKSLVHYRLPFFEGLRTRLGTDGVDLRLVYSPPTPGTRTCGDGVHLDWAACVPLRTWGVGDRAVVWQDCLSHLRDADLVVVEQASKLLVNYLLLAEQALGRRHLAFWGHGRNLRAHASSSTGEALKTFASRRVHWWFAYNALSRRIVEGLGYPAHRITDVQNSIDTRGLQARYQSLSDPDVQTLRRRLRMGNGPVGLFVGGMYPEKRIPFLMDACRRIRRAVPSFEMVWVGDGPDADIVRTACARHPWMHFAGPVFGTDRVVYFRLADVFLMPGLVGLALLDALALETPLVTTRVPYHSPEIEYLVPDHNGLCVPRPNDVDAYVRAVVGLIQNETLRRRLIDAGLRTSRRCSIEAMIDRFAEGTLRALGAPPLPRVPSVLSTLIPGRHS